MGRSIQGNQTSRNCYWKKTYLASKGKVCADISPWITITEAALEIRDQAGGLRHGGLLRLCHDLLLWRLALDIAMAY